MSPEQLQGRPSHASDIYALGVIAYEMLTGRRPFNPETAAQLLELQRGGVKIMPCDLRPSLPRAAQAVILKSLSFAPEDRYASAKDFTEDLARALANAPNTQEQIIERSVVSEIPGAALTISASNLRQDRSRRYKMALTVFAIAALGATALAWQTFSNNEDRRTEPQRRPPQNQVECQLSYSLTVRRNPKIFPNQRSFSLPGEMLFGAGDQVCDFRSASHVMALSTLSINRRNCRTDCRCTTCSSPSRSTIGDRPPFPPRIPCRFRSSVGCPRGTGLSSTESKAQKQSADLVRRRITRSRSGQGLGQSEASRSRRRR